MSILSRSLCVYKGKNCSDSLQFLKKIIFSLNIPGRFGIIITTIENVVCKIGGFEVKIQHLITINQLPLTNLPEKANLLNILDYKWTKNTYLAA